MQLWLKKTIFAFAKKLDKQPNNILYQKLNQTMKKTNYVAPAIESVEMAIEQGIAASIQTVDGVSEIYLTEEDVVW